MKHMDELMLTEVLDLRLQISVGSLFLKGYENNLGVDPREVMNFFGGYVEYLEEMCKEANDPGLDWRDFDTTKNLANWYCIAI